MLARPIIQRPIGRPGIKGQHLPIRPKPRHVAYPAQVQNGERLRQRGGQRAVEYRHQRRALAAGGDIGAAEIIGNTHARAARQQSGIADLPGEGGAGAPLCGGTMQDGLSVKADQICRQANGLHRLRMALGQAARRVQQGWVIGRQALGAVQQGAQRAAQGRIIGQGLARAEARNRLPICFQIGSIHAIQ